MLAPAHARSHQPWPGRPLLGSKLGIAGEYIDRILRGTRASEIPVEEPTEPEIILNLQTAQMLGLEIPNSLLDRITATVG